MEMKMKRLKALGLVAALALTLAVPGLSPAGDMYRDKDRDMNEESVQLREELRMNTSISDDDMNTMSKELNEYARRTRDREQIRELVKASLEEGCRGECLSELVDAMNDSIKRGMSPVEAQSLVTETLRQQKQERKELSGKDLGERVRERVEANVRQMKMDKDMKKMERMDKMMEHKGMDMENGMGGMGGGKGR